MLNCLMCQVKLHTNGIEEKNRKIGEMESDEFSMQRVAGLVWRFDGKARVGADARNKFEQSTQNTKKIPNST